jgi:hypothetical protein
LQLLSRHLGINGCSSLPPQPWDPLLLSASSASLWFKPIISAPDPGFPVSLSSSRMFFFQSVTTLLQMDFFLNLIRPQFRFSLAKTVLFCRVNIQMSSWPGGCPLPDLCPAPPHRCPAQMAPAPGTHPFLLPLRSRYPVVLLPPSLLTQAAFLTFAVRASLPLMVSTLVRSPPHPLSTYPYLHSSEQVQPQPHGPREHLVGGRGCILLSFVFLAFRTWSASLVCFMQVRGPQGA